MNRARNRIVYFFIVSIALSATCAKPNQAWIRTARAKNSITKLINHAAKKIDGATEILAPLAIVLGTAYVGYHNWVTPAQLVDYCNAVGQCVLINENPTKSYLAPLMAVGVFKAVKAAIKEIASGKTA